MEAWIVLALVAVGVVAVFHFVRWVVTRINVLIDEAKADRRYEMEERDRLTRKMWELRHEMESGFESLGMQRRSPQPAIGATWHRVEPPPQ